jgi:hypothetical protein
MFLIKELRFGRKSERHAIILGFESAGQVGFALSLTAQLTFRHRASYI